MILLEFPLCHDNANTNIEFIPLDSCPAGSIMSVTYLTHGAGQSKEEKAPRSLALIDVIAYVFDRVGVTNSVAELQ